MNAPIGGGTSGAIDGATGTGAIDESNGGGGGAENAGGGAENAGGGGTAGAANAGGGTNGAANAGGGGADGAANAGGGADIGSPIEAGIGSGDCDALRFVTSPTTAIGGAVRGTSSNAVVDGGLRSSGSAIGSVDGLLGDALGATDAETIVRGATDAETVRGATEGGAGGATDGARGAIGAWLARAGMDAMLARGAIDAGFAAATGTRPDASLIRRVPGAALTGAGTFSTIVLTGGASRPFVRSASASAMSGGSPCAVAASS